MDFFPTGMSENGTIHITMMKNGVSHILFLRKGAFHIPGSLEKGGYSARSSVLCHVQVVSPPRV